MKKGYKIVHKEQTNYPHFIFLHNFKFLNEVRYTYSFNNKYVKTRSLTGRWIIKYKTT